MTSENSSIFPDGVFSMLPFGSFLNLLSQGVRVRIFNDRGACLAAAQLDANIRADVVALPTGAWFNPKVPGDTASLELAGNPNVLTRDVGTSALAQGPSSGTCLVEVERWRG